MNNKNKSESKSKHLIFHNLLLFLKVIDSFFTNVIIKVIRIYQKTAPRFVRNSCRYEPCCSDYAIISLQKKGTAIGLLFSICRILRCFPPFGGTDYP